MNEITVIREGDAVNFGVNIPDSALCKVMFIFNVRYYFSWANQIFYCPNAHIKLCVPAVFALRC
jgi:hypothetical protein